MPTKFLTPAEVAAKLKVSRQTVIKWLDQGRIKSLPVGQSGRRIIAARDARRPKALKRGPKPVEAYLSSVKGA